MHKSINNIPPIAVLMATYNGAPYLQEQLDSIISQSLQPSIIIVSDDGSTDATQSILETYANNGKITFIKNASTHGVVGNFLNCLNQLPKGYYFALADQDDIWHQNKLEKCFEAIQKIEIENLPCMVYTDLRLIDERKNIINNSFRNELGHNKYKHCLETLLFGNFVLGCTTLSNYKMKEYLLKVPVINNFNHDAWMALVSFSVGKSFSIDDPLVNYRQHANNVTLSNHIKKTRLERYLTHIKFLFSKNNFLNDRFIIIELFLEEFNNLIPNDNLLKFKQFIRLKNKSYLFKKISFEISFFTHWTKRFS